MTGWRARHALRPDRSPWTRADPKANACVAIRRELDLAEDFDCDTEWDADPVNLASAPIRFPPPWPWATARRTGTGDMVLVRIGWNREALSFGGDGNPRIKTVPMVAIGLARCELELCGYSTI